MLDVKDKTLENTELHSLAEEAPDASLEETRRQQRLAKCEKICKTSIKNVGRVNVLWYCVALFSLLAAVALHLFACS